MSSDTLTVECTHGLEYVGGSWEAWPQGPAWGGSVPLCAEVREVAHTGATHCARARAAAEKLSQYRFIHRKSLCRVLGLRCVLVREFRCFLRP